jgi:outer membrane protein assembly factor BamB
MLAALIAAILAAAPSSAQAASTNFDWPLFGLSPSRPDATSRSIGITAADAPRLQRHTVSLPGTVDSSPVYLHAASVAGGRHDVFVMTTTYGRTLAVDAGSGQILWTFTPPGVGGWEGSAQITNASPAATRRFVYAASPDGRVHKLRLSNGREAGGRWPVSITRDATHEKLTSSFNLLRGRLLVTTGGYIGDAPPYQGHAVSIDARTGRILAVFNSLCSDRRRIIVPRTCPSSDSAIWGRSGAVRISGRWLMATGNAPFNGRTDWGDSVLALDDRLRLRAHFTPPDQAQLNSSDSDLGSSVPAAIGGGSVLQGGKDSKLRVLRLPSLRQIQQLPTPGNSQLLTAPAVWRHGRSTTVFVTTFSGTAAYAQRGGRLKPLWSNGTAGTSPVVAGGLLYVYDPGGGLVVYRPGSGAVVARLPAGAGHWNSPVPGGGRIALPEGNANDHRRDGTLNLYSVG